MVEEESVNNKKLRTFKSSRRYQGVSSYSSQISVSIANTHKLPSKNPHKVNKRVRLTHVRNVNCGVHLQIDVSLVVSCCLSLLGCAFGMHLPAGQPHVILNQPFRPRAFSYSSWMLLWGPPSLDVTVVTMDFSI